MIGCWNSTATCCGVAGRAAVAHREQAPAACEARRQRARAAPRVAPAFSSKNCAPERRRSRAPCAGSRLSSALAVRAEVPAVLVVGGAGALGRHHGRAERRLRACTPCRTPGSRDGFFRPRRISPLMQRADSRGVDARRPRSSRSASCVAVLVAQPVAATWGCEPTPRHLRSHDLEDLVRSSARGAVARRGTTARSTGSRPRRGRPRAGARSAARPRAGRPARSR